VELMGSRKWAGAQGMGIACMSVNVWKRILGAVEISSRDLIDRDALYFLRGGEGGLEFARGAKKM